MYFLFEKNSRIIDNNKASTSKAISLITNTSEGIVLVRKITEQNLLLANLKEKLNGLESKSFLFLFFFEKI
jgi:hypothetical protein